MPRSEVWWGCVRVDANGFIIPGPELEAVVLKTPAAPGGNPRWPLARAPQLMETSLPGVFAVGDARAGNVKRVASAVGEGAISIHMVQQALAEV